MHTGALAQRGDFLRRAVEDAGAADNRILARRGPHRNQFSFHLLPVFNVTHWPHAASIARCIDKDENSFVLPYRGSRLLPPMTSSPKTCRADYAVVGSGVAGLRAAIELSSTGSVLVLAKSDLSDSATACAQSGIAVALSDEDEIGLPAQDTHKAAHGLCPPETLSRPADTTHKYLT